MKLIYFADLHLVSITPRRRKDNLPSVQLAKLKEVLSIAEQERADYVVYGGDFFDHAVPRLSLIGDALKVLQHSKIRTIIGNHDIIGGNMATLERCGLGILKYTPGVEVLEPGHLDANVYIYPVHFNNPVYPKNRKAKLVIGVAHEMFTPVSVPYPHKLIAEMPDIHTDIMLCSHYHHPFSVSSKYTQFINPGSLTRMSIDDVRDFVAVVVVETTADGCSVRFVTLQTGKEYNEVFMEAKKPNIEMTRFFDVLSKVEIKNTNFMTVIDSISQEQSIDPEVRTEAVNRVTKMKNKLESKNV